MLKPDVVFGFMAFAALCPLAFMVRSGVVTPLLETPFRYVVWLLLGLSAVLMLVANPVFSKKQLIGLTALYGLAPLAFRFSGTDVHWLMLDQFPYTAAFIWLIACIFAGKLVLAQKRI